MVYIFTYNIYLLNYFSNKIKIIDEKFCADILLFRPTFNQQHKRYKIYHNIFTTISFIIFYISKIIYKYYSRWKRKDKTYLSYDNK